MKISDFLLMERDIGNKILRDPRLSKMLSIAWRHDVTIPRQIKAELGPKPTEQQIVEKWGEMVDHVLTNTSSGDLSADGRFDLWLARIYSQGGMTWEELSGEAVDALANWYKLSATRNLSTEDQDFNRFKTFDRLMTINAKYDEQIRQLKARSELERLKRESDEVVLIDNDRFFVAVPFNYGSCYAFNNGEGVIGNFCTGGSQGREWFKDYAPSGPIIMITDKNNLDDVNGKWQIHAQTHQIYNARQENRGLVSRNSQNFGKLFPGLLKKIALAMLEKSSLLDKKSEEKFGKPYNISGTIEEFKKEFPSAWSTNE